MSHSEATGSPLPLDYTEEEPVKLNSNQIHNFIEPVILLVALTDAARTTAPSRPREENINDQDPKQLFYAFVNKLSHVCDRNRGGTSVTSFAVLKDQMGPHMVHYVFAVNQQTLIELQNTRSYVTTLLRIVGQAPEGRENQHDARHSLLYHVLRFNRPRVSFYLRKLRAQAEFCLEKCQAEITDDNELLAEGLREILNSPDTGSDANDTEADYIQKCVTTIRQLIRFEQSIVGELIEERAVENRMAGYTSMECWPEIFHTIRRILAYQLSVQFFLTTKDRWPNLFENFTVHFISSSRPAPKHGRNKSYSANSIVGRMTGEADQMATYREFVQGLQAFDLDDRIKQEFSKKTFKPIVHAEVLLLNWISNQGEILPSRFFNDWKYIGSSKPTCKLCDYYFNEHGSNVEHRVSHGNLYPSWRVPDVFPHQGKPAEKMRQVMLDRLRVLVRRDAFNIVLEKALPSVKKADSNTNSAWMTLLEVRTLQRPGTDVDDLASIMGQVEIH